VTFRRAELTTRRSRWGVLAFVELLIGGKSIPELLLKHARFRSAMLDTCISPLGWLDAAGGQVSLVRFLPDGPPDFPNGNRAVLVCRECGDFGCGALTIRIEAQGPHIVWSDWLWQATYDESQRNGFGQRVPRFAFEREAYADALRKALVPE
jgi:hypothetical protein